MKDVYLTPFVTSKLTDNYTQVINKKKHQLTLTLKPMETALHQSAVEVRQFIEPKTKLGFLFDSHLSPIWM